jgi:gamma-glutamylcyclotransferase (GGCT)/AIG2-like uncharacterized protein YtfP
MPGANHASASLPGPEELLFAYGTLKTGGQYHHLLQAKGAELLGTGRLAIPYPLILAQFPCLLDKPGTGYRVEGEIYRIHDPDDWTKLDWLEDHPHEYYRRPEKVETGNGILIAWTYFYLQPDRLDPALPPVDEFRID